MSSPPCFEASIALTVLGSNFWAQFLWRTWGEVCVCLLNHSFILAGEGKQILGKGCPEEVYVPGCLSCVSFGPANSFHLKSPYMLFPLPSSSFPALCHLGLAWRSPPQRSLLLWLLHQVVTCGSVSSCCGVFAIHGKTVLFIYHLTHLEPLPPEGRPQTSSFFVTSSALHCVIPRTQIRPPCCDCSTNVCQMNVCIEFTIIMYYMWFWRHGVPIYCIKSDTDFALK